MTISTPILLILTISTPILLIMTPILLILTISTPILLIMTILTKKTTRDRNAYMENTVNSAPKNTKYSHSKSRNRNKDELSISQARTSTILTVNSASDISQLPNATSNYSNQIIRMGMSSRREKSNNMRSSSK